VEGGEAQTRPARTPFRDFLRTEFVSQNLFDAGPDNRPVVNNEDLHFLRVWRTPSFTTRRFVTDSFGRRPKMSSNTSICRVILSRAWRARAIAPSRSDMYLKILFAKRTAQ
jgi:hypothetical protein